MEQIRDPLRVLLLRQRKEKVVSNDEWGNYKMLIAVKCLQGYWGFWIILGGSFEDFATNAFRWDSSQAKWNNSIAIIN